MKQLPSLRIPAGLLALALLLPACQDAGPSGPSDSALRPDVQFGITDGLDLFYAETSSSANWTIGDEGGLMADDFTVPAGDTWVVTHVAFITGGDPWSTADEVYILTWNGDQATAASQVHCFSGVSYSSEAAPEYGEGISRFMVQLPGSGVELTAGTYWLGWRSNHGWRMADKDGGSSGDFTVFYPGFNYDYSYTVDAYFELYGSGTGSTDTEGPVTSNVLVAQNPASVSETAVLTADVDDSGTGGSHIKSAKYRYSTDGGDNWSGWLPMAASDGGFDETSEAVTADLTASVFDDPGVYLICVLGIDAADNIGTEVCTTFAVYDPSAGFVTGGGWIYSAAGSYAPDPSLEGQASFGFVSRYKKGASAPDGNTQFVFEAGELTFQSYAYEWLVVTGGDYARFKGEGTINGAGAYEFMLWAGDGDPDTFRIKVWEEIGGVETVVYDNGMDQPIGGGNIIVHAK